MRTFALFVLTAIGLGLFACRPDMPPIPPSTPMAVSAEVEDLPLTPVSTFTSPATAVPVPMLASVPNDPFPMASPVPGIAPGLSPIEPVLVTNGDRSLPYIALTFDACQAAGYPSGYDGVIIRILSATDTPATLFLGGLWMQSHLAQTQALASNPLFELGNHSWSHLDFAKISPEEMGTEIMRTQDLMVKLTGRQPTLFRFPFDTYTDDALAVVGRHGLRAIKGDVITGDADLYISAADIVNVVTTQAQNGSIVIMHVNGRGWHTAEALPAVIQGLRAKGYTFVTVSQLLGLAPLPASVSHNGDLPKSPR